MYKICIFLVVFFTILLKAEVITYSPPEQFQSEKYNVTIEQNGDIFSSFVYQDKNKFTDNLNVMTDWNHWTTFAFSQPITITVTKLSGDIQSATVYPLRWDIEPTIDGSNMTFSISEPAKLFIKMNGMSEHPLFIFADAPETDVPEKDDPNVVWFDGGAVHDIGMHYRVEAGKTYYLEGGAYVKGSFQSSNNASNITIRGRGILSGENIEHCPYSECQFERVAIHLPGGGARNLVVNDVTIINPGMYCIRNYGGQLFSTNVKCFGWWFETDGWVGGDGSELSDSFFKVYDDVVKVYFDDMHIHDLVIYHQHNGAPFQFGWGGETSNNNLIEDIDIVADDCSWSPQFNSNRTLVNMANGSTVNQAFNATFQNIRIDQDITQIIGIKTAGQVNNITLKNVSVRGKQNYKPYLQGGHISNIRFENVTIAGELVTSAEQMNLAYKGDVTGISFGAPNTEPPAAPTELNIESIVGRSIELSWIDNSVNEDQFVIERSADQSTWVEIGRVHFNVTIFKSILPDNENIFYYRVFAVNGVGPSDVSNTISATATVGNLPSPWENSDIGQPALQGSAEYAGGTFIIHAGGVDIWETADEFHYVFMPYDGDIEIIAKVNSLGATDPWAKSGVMIRESLNAGSKHAMMIMSSSNGSSFQRRTTTNGNSEHTTPGNGQQAPHWVKLVRRGSDFTGYSSDNGTNWVEIGAAQIDMIDDVYVGLAVTSHEASRLTTSELSDVTINGEPVGVGSKFETAPFVFELKQNYPNPFNPSTTISFTLPQRAHTKLHVCNVRGQIVQTLIERDLRAGHHSVVWNASSHPNGIYYYQVLADDVRDIRKMVLLK